jgi:hypothetical protein
MSHAEADCITGTIAGAPAPVRAVTLTNLRVEHNVKFGEYMGMQAYADIGTVTMKGKTLVAEVRFRVPGGAAIKPPPNVQGVSGIDGAVALSQQDTAVHDNASWTPFRIFVPYLAFGLPAGRHRLIMICKASCEDLAAASEQEIDVVVPSRVREAP